MRILLLNLLPLLVIMPPFCYGLVSLVCAGRFFARATPEQGPLIPVTIIKPVKGLDDESYENFASFCCQDYPEYQLVFSVASADDPVVPVLERIVAEYSGLAIDLVVDGRIHGPNYKVSNLINAYPVVRHDIIVISDSDIRVDPGYLRKVAAPFADHGVGLVTLLYRTSLPTSWPAAMEALGFTVEMIPNVLMARCLEGLSFALGATMAVRRQALEKIGGFQALVTYLADDYQLGNMVRSAGYRLELSSYIVESVTKPECLYAIVSRQLRWARTMRISRPAGYCASGLIQPVPAALLALTVSGFSRQGLLAVGLLGMFRLVQALLFSRAYVKDSLLPRYLWLLPIRDILATVTWCAAFFGNRVVWRGHVFRVQSGGKMVEDGVTPSL